jgi:HAD superfamily hydrolase (TIGR01548 family)
MKKPFDALIFDMDGVLVDVSKSYRKVIQKTAEYFLKRQVKMSEVNALKEMVGMNNDWDSTYRLIGNKSLDYEKVKNIFQKLYLGTNEAQGLINNEKLLIKKESLMDLKRKYKKLGIATGRPKEEALYVINKFQLQEIFEVLVAKEDTKKEKPFPDPIVKAIRDLKAENSVYIGDSPSDVVAAKAAGIPCFYIGKQNMGTIRFKSMLKIVEYLL